MTPIIEIKNLSKKYNIAHRRGGYIALRDVLTTALKNPFSFIIKKTKEFAGRDTKEEFWALKDINIEIGKGEVVGIIGHNGAGKSTLMKILSQITYPSNGEIIIRGKVGSLLEVGTGFHPELSGRENIVLNGAILGMTGKEIEKKFDDIVKFAGIEKFLDTPVKYYSSGMYVRLAFSVAAHLEPDILLVDEVLAVGDAEFQKKCLGKMDEITKKEGRTILFVSHNMGAIKSLCQKTMLLKNGKIEKFGPTQNVIEYYLNEAQIITDSDINNFPRWSTDGVDLRIDNCQLINFENKQATSLLFGEPFSLMISAKSKKTFSNLKIIIKIESIDGQSITTPTSEDADIFYSASPESPLKIMAEFKNLILVPGIYWVSFSIVNQDAGGRSLDQLVKIINFEVSTTPFNNYKKHSGTWGYVHTIPEWHELK